MNSPLRPPAVLAVFFAATAAGCGPRARWGEAGFRRLLATRLEFRQWDGPVGAALAYEQYPRLVEPGPAPPELRPFLQHPSSLSLRAYMRGEASDLRLRGEGWRGRSGLLFEAGRSEHVEMLAERRLGPSEDGRGYDLCVGAAQFVKEGSRYAVLYRFAERTEAGNRRYVDHILDVIVSCAAAIREGVWFRVSGGPRVSILQHFPCRLDLRLEAALYFGDGASVELLVQTDVERYLLTVAKHAAAPLRLCLGAGAVGDEAVGELGLEWRF